MLYNLPDMLKAKMIKLIYCRLLYCVNDNKTAQEVLRATPDDFKILCVRLHERFPKNTDVEKDRLRQQFETIRMTGKDTLRDFDGRIVTFVTELRTTIQCGDFGRPD